MTISEFQILLDLNRGNEKAILEEHCHQTDDGNWLFVDSNDGQCYLFSIEGKMLNIKMLREIPYSLFAGFADDSRLKKIIIPNSVMRIENWAFYTCNELTSMTIPSSVTSIGDYAFYNCSGLMSVTIGDNVTSIGDRAFCGCSGLTSVTISNNVTSIGFEAFRGCSGLMSVTIPNKVTSIGYATFYSCSNLKNLIFKGKTLDQVKAMDYYPWELADELAIKCKS